MKRHLLPCLVALLATLAIPASRASAALYTFEEAPLTDPFGAAIPNGFAGLNWDHMSYFNGTSVIAVPNSGFVNGIVSPPNVAYNTNGLAAAITAISGTFNFMSAYFTAGWNNGLNLDLKGYLNGTLTNFASVTIDTTAPIIFNPNFIGIDTMTLVSSGGTRAPNTGSGPGGVHFVMDNATITLTAPTPEPTSLALVATGAALLITRARKARRICEVR